MHMRPDMRGPGDYALRLRTGIHASIPRFDPVNARLNFFLYLRQMEALCPGVDRAGSRPLTE